jgi:hypothetical protein
MYVATSHLCVALGLAAKYSKISVQTRKTHHACQNIRCARERIVRAGRAPWAMGTYFRYLDLKVPKCYGPMQLYIILFRNIDRPLVGDSRLRHRGRAAFVCGLKLWASGLRPF